MISVPLFHIDIQLTKTNQKNQFQRDNQLKKGINLKINRVNTAKRNYGQWSRIFQLCLIIFSFFYIIVILIITNSNMQIRMDQLLKGVLGKAYGWGVPVVGKFPVAGFVSRGQKLGVTNDDDEELCVTCEKCIFILLKIWLSLRFNFFMNTIFLGPAVFI